MNVLVIGYGVSGKSAEALLSAQGHFVFAVDRSAKECHRDDETVSLEGIGQVIVSPGISQEHPLIKKARALGVEVIGEAELGARYLRNRCFGITGSNGKTTATLLTEHILNACGKKAKAVGNVGHGLCAYAAKADLEEILVIELSSFQLETLHTKFLEAAIVLNITPNHLDRHSDMLEYASAKARIGILSEELFCSDQVLEEFQDLFRKAQRFEIDLKKKLPYIEWEMASKQSAMAAYLLCKRCGVTDVDFLRGLKSFKKPAHRIEWVAEIEGVSYYNDSKSSNIHSTLHALEQLEGPIVLIAGGVHKGASYIPWRTHRNKVKAIVAYGQAADLMEVELAAYFPFCKTEKFADAVQLAKEQAKIKEKVLLSPGCSSYDQFPSYEHRGNEFKRLVEEMK